MITSHHSTSDAQSSVLWMFFTNIVRDAKWSDCVSLYEQARINIDSQSLQQKYSDQSRLFLANAMLEVCMIYAEHDNGWMVYEGIKGKCDRHTIIVVMTLAWKAFFIAQRNPSECKESINIQLRKWEARAWAIYGRMKSSDSALQSYCCTYITTRLKDIVRQSPEVESRAAKLLHIETNGKS